MPKEPVGSPGVSCAAIWVTCIVRIGCSALVGAQTQTTYSATWASLNKHTPAPEWFQDAKFGIYFHWGVYSVPAFGSEWYPRNMYNKAGNSAEYNHQLSVYGDPFGNWPYNNFMSGANDKQGHFVQFAPKLVSDGGNWDPSAWAQIFVDAGARYAGPSMEHHDGFSMWDSKVNPWNSVAYGPKLNLAQLHVNAYRSAGLKIVAALHTAYHFNGYFQYAPAQTDPNLKILYAQTGTANENDLWLGKIKEVVDEFQPDILWQDFDLNLVDQTHLMESLQYYYNAAIGWDKEVVATYKDGYNNQGEVYDYERGGPAAITTPYWLTDDAIGVNSWCYTQGMAYYSPQAVLDAVHRSCEQRRQSVAQYLADVGWHHSARAVDHPQHHRHLPEAERDRHLQHTGVDGLRRGPHEDGGRLVHESDRRNVERRSLHQIQGRKHSVRDLDGVAGKRQAGDHGVGHDGRLPHRNRQGLSLRSDGWLGHRAHLHAGRVRTARHASHRPTVHRGRVRDGDQPQCDAARSDALARQRRSRRCGRRSGRGRGLRGRRPGRVRPGWRPRRRRFRCLRPAARQAGQ